MTGGLLVLDTDTVAETGSGSVGPRLRTALARTPAVPRHYILALPWRTIGQDDPGRGHAYLYEPSSGSVRALDLTARRDPHRPAHHFFRRTFAASLLQCPAEHVVLVPDAGAV